MAAATNILKAALLDGQLLYGLWLGFGSARIAELAGGAGFDWCLVDAEHGPNSLADVQMQLMALRGRPAQAVVRVASGEDWMLKQALDIGAQSVMVPMVETAEQARGLVRAVRYPPEGIRGTAPAITRATDYAGGVDYVRTANAQICLMVQIESRAAVAAIPDIAAIDGVDVLFLGPADLAADMGFSADADTPEVQAVMKKAITAIRDAGKVAGILAPDLAQAAEFARLGARFVGVGTDVQSMARALRGLASDAGAALR